MQLKSDNLYEFGPFVLDTAQHLLSRQGNPVALTPKTYDLLVVLVKNRGRLLPKEELIKTLWPDTFVEESNLTQQISAARKALGETTGDYRFIVTVPGRGYRFAAEVREPESAVLPKPRMVTIRKRNVLALTALLLLIIVGGYILYWQRPLASPRSLAILPFQSLNDDSESAFLGFSLADAVITKLGAVKSLTVRPSSAVEEYRRQPIDFRRAAEELHVDALLTGNFLRDGNDLRITCQLIDVPAQNILWKGDFNLKYDRLLTVHDNVAVQIVKGLQLRLSPGEVESLQSDKAVDPMAYEYYLRGVDLYARNEFPMAVRMLRKSAEIDPSYSLTWAHLGRALTASASFELGGRDEYREAQTAYEKSLSLHPAPIEASVYMANLFTDTGQAERAVPLLRDALRTNQNHPEVHWELGYAYRFAGMLKESAEACEHARQLDPGVKIGSSALNAYLYLGQYDRFLQSLPKDNDSALIVFYRAFGLYHKGDLNQAAAQFDRAFELKPTLLHARIGKALSDGIRHQTQRGIEVLRDIETKIAARGVGDPEALYKVAESYAVLGDPSAATHALRASIEGGFFSYPYMAADPLLKSLHGGSEFERLLASAEQRHLVFKRRFF
jgi:DNA-binding winged helix-turn-helix (wHTH) protein/TolB-like protein/Flp pilus assembly protein TadD